MKGLFIGTTTIDLIYPLDIYPEEDSKSNVIEQIITLGGPATNAAITFAALGGEATLLSPIGNSFWTAYIHGELEKFKVRHFDPVAGLDFSPSVSSILVNQSNGRRTVITVPGKELNQVQNVTSLNISDYDICCLDGFHADLVLQQLKRKPEALKVIFDGGSYKHKTDQLLTLVDFPIFSERFQFPDGQILSHAMNDLRINQYAITYGGQPIEVYQDKIKSIIEVPQVNAIDTLAAGDIFHGAFSYYIYQTGDFEISLAKSAEIASLSCQNLGPRAWIDLI